METKGLGGQVGAVRGGPPRPGELPKTEEKQRRPRGSPVSPHI